MRSVNGGDGTLNRRRRRGVKQCGKSDSGPEAASSELFQQPFLRPVQMRADGADW